MSLLDDASLLVTPNAEKEGKLYSIIPTNGNGDFSVTRATTATRVNAAGLVELVPYNLLTYSEMFSNVLWVKNASTITDNTTTAPNGLLTADTITANGTSAAHLVSQVVTLNSGTSYAATFYVKKSTNDFVQIYSYNATGGQFANFDINSGAVGSVGTTFGSNPTSSITSIGNGWYRCAMVLSAAVTASSGFGIAIVSSNSATRIETNSLSTSVFLWGAQLVEGTSALDYQATETRLNIPRLDYSLGSCPNILLEPQMTNVLTFSEEFNNAAWLASEVTISPNVGTSPSGVMNADKFIPTTANATHQIRRTGLASAAYTASIYAKADGETTFSIWLRSASVFAAFDLSNGTITSTSIGVVATITAVGNGWYRCTAYNPTPGTTLNIYGRSGSAFVGNGTSGILFWGAQLEAGAYATSYIPTTSATVTRNADVISRTGISSLLNPSEMTLFVESKGFVNDITNRFIQISNGTDTSNAFINFANNQIILATVSAGTQYNRTVSVNPSNNNKIVLSWKSGSIFCFINGIKYNLTLASGTGNGIPTALDRITFSLWWGGNPFYGNIKTLAIWNTQLTDTQCIALTT